MMKPIEAIEAKKEKKIVASAILAGMMMYLSKFLRPYFSDHNFALFILVFYSTLDWH